jgi:hypothetical protein
MLLANNSMPTKPFGNNIASLSPRAIPRRPNPVDNRLASSNKVEQSIDRS